MSLARMALGLVALLALVGCSGFDCDAPPCPQPYPQPGPQPCQPVCDVCPPAAPVPTDPCGTPPPAANLGEVWCYVRVPAVTRTIEEQCCVQPATCRQEWVPPVTQEVTEQVCVCPEQVCQRPVPAKYETVCEQVLVCPAKTEWQKVACEPTSLGEGEQLGECWTLCEIPPVYKTCDRQVCVSPASCIEEVTPARYETCTKTCTVQEGYYKSIEVPAVFETRCREEIVCPCRWEWRRTTECEVPDVVGGVYPEGVYPGYEPAPVAPAAPAPGTSGFESMPLPPDNLPPAGTLPPADPFAP